MVNNNFPEIYRKRFIPDEIIHLKDDEIVECEDNYLITRWKALKPRKDIARGISYFAIDKGYKVSKVFNHENSLVYIYCDIIRTLKDDKKNEIVFEDLLADVIIYNDGHSEVVDLDELIEAKKAQIIDETTFMLALTNLDTLLKDIYSGQINKSLELIETFNK